MRTHYQNLKVRQDASQAEIKAAYRRLRSEHHPDRNKDPDATHRMQLINEAWEVLSDPKKRAKHDAAIARHNEFEKLLREMEEKAASDVRQENEIQDDLLDDEIIIDEEIEANGVGIETDKVEYYDRVGRSWVEYIKNSKPRNAPEPTYAVYRTDFTVGSITYHYYAIDSYEVARRCGRSYGSPKPVLKGSRYVSCRLVNQALMDRIMEGNGVLWVEGDPEGDMTLRYRG